MKSTSIVLLLALMLIVPVHGQNTLTVKSVKAVIYGSSTLHDWESDVKEIACKAKVIMEGEALKGIENIQARIPVESIKSHEGRIMDHKTYEAFQSDINPFITFEAQDAKVTVTATHAIFIEAAGNLTMAGATRAITVVGKGKILPNRDLEIEVSQKLKMTDYKMEPPTALMGTIKVGDEVTVKINLVLTPSADLTKALSN